MCCLYAPVGSFQQHTLSELRMLAGHGTASVNVVKSKSPSGVTRHLLKSKCRGWTPSSSNDDNTFETNLLTCVQAAWEEYMSLTADLGTCGEMPQQ